jgi:N utilization substance protein B
MHRRRAREEALKMLFQRDFSGQIDELELITDEYVLDVLRGIEAHQAEIDPIIQERAEGWHISRLHSVDRNLLRLAIYELYYRKDIPPEVVINEAVELAKRYGTEKSPAFVNAILDRVRKDKVST